MFLKYPPIPLPRGAWIIRILSLGRILEIHGSPKTDTSVGYISYSSEFFGCHFFYRTLRILNPQENSMTCETNGGVHNSAMSMQESAEFASNVS